MEPNLHCDVDTREAANGFRSLRKKGQMKKERKNQRTYFVEHQQKCRKPRGHGSIRFADSHRESFPQTRERLYIGPFLAAKKERKKEEEIEARVSRGCEGKTLYDDMFQKVDTLSRQHTLSNPAIFWCSAKNSAGLLNWST